MVVKGRKWTYPLEEKKRKGKRLRAISGDRREREEKREEETLEKETSITRVHV